MKKIFKMFGNKKKIKTYILEQYLNKYQVQVYNYNKDMIYCQIHEGFTFEQACEKALVQVKKTVNEEKMLYPLRFFSSGLKEK